MEAVNEFLNSTLGTIIIVTIGCYAVSILADVVIKLLERFQSYLDTKPVFKATQIDNVLTDIATKIVISIKDKAKAMKTEGKSGDELRKQLRADILEIYEDVATKSAKKALEAEYGSKVDKAIVETVHWVYENLRPKLEGTKGEVELPK